MKILLKNLKEASLKIWSVVNANENIKINTKLNTSSVNKVNEINIKYKIYS